jgi:hypothetical protein
MLGCSWVAAQLTACQQGLNSMSESEGFDLTVGRLHVKQAVKRRILVPSQHLLYDRGKPRKNFIDLACRRTFRM